jgi:hypothetical protein
MSKTDVYVVTHLDIYEHNMGTYRTLTAPKVCWSLEEAQEEMRAMAKQCLADLDFEMDDDSEEAILNRDRFEKVFTMPVFKDANEMKFDAMWFPHPDIEELWDSERFIIEILPSSIDLKTIAAVYSA